MKGDTYKAFCAGEVHWSAFQVIEAFETPYDDGWHTRVRSACQRAIANGAPVEPVHTASFAGHELGPGHSVGGVFVPCGCSSQFFPSTCVLK